MPRNAPEAPIALHAPINGERQGRVPPHNLQAEEALLGAMLLTSTAIETARVYGLEPRSFYKPANGLIFDAINTLYTPNPDTPWVTGADPVTVAGYLRRQGILDECGGDAYIVRLQAGTPSTSNAIRYAEAVSYTAGLRDLIIATGEIAEQAYSQQADTADEALTQAEVLLDEVRGKRPAVVPEGLTTFDELLARKEQLGDDFAPWLIPDVVKRTTRVVVISKSGIGKTLLLQQIWFSAAAGLHPFTHDYLDNPIRALLIDHENPEERIADDRAERMYREARRLSVTDPGGPRERDEWDSSRCALWSYQKPVDITTTRDRTSLENVIKMTAPDLVLMGPLYRLANMEGPGGLQAAAKVMAVLDDLRTKYEFGLILETHAPSNNGMEPNRVRGSEQWNYWPEISFALAEVEDLDAPVSETPPRTFETRRTRGDRVPAVGWPAKIRHNTGPKDGPWPWVVVESDDTNAW